MQVLIHIHFAVSIPIVHGSVRFNHDTISWSRMLKLSIFSATESFNVKPDPHHAFQTLHLIMILDLSCRAQILTRELFHDRYCAATLS